MNPARFLPLLQSRTVLWGLAVLITLPVAAAGWRGFLTPYRESVAYDLARITARQQQAAHWMPEAIPGAVRAAPDMTPLFSRLPDSALPLLIRWQQNRPEHPDRWTLVFEAAYPVLAGLLDTLTESLTPLYITGLLLHPAAGGQETPPLRLRMTLTLARADHPASPVTETTEQPETEFPGAPDNTEEEVSHEQ